MTINEKIVRLRKARGLTQSELGEKLGVTDKAVSKWEQGNGTPDLEQIQSLSEFLNVSLDYLLKDVIQTEDDKAAQHDMEEYEKKLRTKGENDDLRKKCKEYLEGQGITFDEKILPYVERDGKTINFGCFQIHEGKISLSLEKLMEYRQTELIRRFYANQITPEDAIALDDVDLLKGTLQNPKKLFAERDSLVSYNPFNGFPEIRDLKRYNEINLDLLLERLDPNLNNYYCFVVTLIEAGAKYYKQHGQGDDITIFSNEVDQSKTNFAYRVAKDMIDLMSK